MNRSTRGLWGYILLVLLFLFLIFGLRDSFDGAEDCTYREFQELLEEGQILSVEVIQNQVAPTGVLKGVLQDGSMVEVNVSDVNQAQEMMDGYEVEVSVRNVERDSVFLTTILPILLTGVVVVFMMAMMNRQSGGGNAKMMNFGKSRARMISPDSKRVMFRDVAGLQEEKEDLQELVEFLKEPEKFLKVGARIPRAFCWWDLPERERPCWPRPWRGRRESRFSASPAQTLWKCLWAWERPESETCLRTPNAISPVSFL